MMPDEQVAWGLMPDRTKAKVECVAKAMCRSREPDDDDDEPYCEGCDTPAGGSCVAFGLWGNMAIAVVEALDRDGHFKESQP